MGIRATQHRARSRHGRFFAIVTTTVVALACATAPTALGAEPALAATSSTTLPTPIYPNDPPWRQIPWGNQDYLKQIGMPYAWGVQSSAAHQVIAIVDSGVDATNPDLVGVVLPGYDTEGSDDATTDPYGSGTLEAGIAAAHANNDVGIAGIAWGAKILPVRVTDAHGAIEASDVASGITWAADHGATVINVSITSHANDPAIYNAVEAAIAEGIVVVASAGNTYTTYPNYPAADPGVISVNGDGGNQHLANYSPVGNWIDISAPSVDIEGLQTAQAISQGGVTTSGDGSTLAAPIVSGIAALMLEHTPGLTPAQVLQRLEHSALDTGPIGVDPYHGYGEVNPLGALLNTTAGTPPAPTPDSYEPNDTPTQAATIGASASATIGIEGDVDWYRYWSTGGRLAVTVTPNPDSPDGSVLDPVLDVYDSGVHLLDHENQNSTGQPETAHISVAAGWVYVEVHDRTGTATAETYAITIAADPLTGSYFGQAYDYPLGDGQTQSVATGDITGDGLPDVVVVNGAPLDLNPNPNSCALFVIPQLPDGNLSPQPARYPLDDPTCNIADQSSVAIADFTGDGLSDVAVSTEAGVEIFAQTAAGTLTDDGIIAGSEPNALLTAGDVNGDGLSDLVEAGVGETDALLQTSNGFTASLITADYSSIPAKIGNVLGGAGAQVVQLANSAVEVFTDVDGSWHEQSFPMKYLGEPVGLALGDFTRDGRLDVGAVDAADDITEVFDQQPGGGLAAYQGIPPWMGNSSTVPFDLATGDIDGNGYTDVVECCAYGDSYTQLQYSTGFSFPSLAENTLFWSEPTVSPAAFVLSDINGDGRADALYATYEDGLMFAYSDAGPSLTKQHALPWVMSVTPAAGSPGAESTHPSVHFGRPISAASVTTATVQLLDTRTGEPVPSAVSFSAATNTATLTPLQPLYDTVTYRLVVSGVQGIDGSSMTNSLASTFTIPNVAPPPVSGAVVAGHTGSATLTWQQPHAVDLSRVVVRLASGTTGPSSPTSGTGVYSGTGTTVAVSGLAAGHTYTAAIWAVDATGLVSAPVNVRISSTALTVVSPTHAVAGGTATFTGTVTRADTHARVAGVTVQLMALTAGKTIWLLVASGTSNTSGTVTLTARPTVNTRYELTDPGTVGLVGTHTAVVSVPVGLSISAKLASSTTHVGHPVSLTGKIGTGGAGRRVYLEKVSNGAWVVVTSIVASSTGTFTLPVPATTKGHIQYRAYLSATSLRVASASTPTTLTVS